MERIKFVGLEVHAETIAVAVAEQDGEVRPHRVCSVLATDGTGSEVRSGGANAGAGEIGRAGED